MRVGVGGQEIITHRTILFGPIAKGMSGDQAAGKTSAEKQTGTFRTAELNQSGGDGGGVPKRGLAVFFFLFSLR